MQPLLTTATRIEYKYAIVSNSIPSRVIYQLHTPSYPYPTSAFSNPSSLAKVIKEDTQKGLKELKEQISHLELRLGMVGWELI